MSRRAYSEINLHVIWHTKLSHPFLVGAVEEGAHRAIRRKLAELPGVICHALGGIETHVHVAVSIPPTILISDLVGQVKGFSSHEVNRAVHNGKRLFEWQGGYGVVTLGTQHLEWVVRYIDRQKEHHAGGTVHPRLERTESEGDEEAAERAVQDSSS